MGDITKNTRGIVYFIHAPDVNRLKIGFTQDVKTRFSKLSRGSPVKLELLNYVNGTQGLEAVMLALFEKFKVHHEWFEADPLLLNFVRGLAQGGEYTPDMLIAK